MSRIPAAFCMACMCHEYRQQDLQSAISALMFFSFTMDFFLFFALTAVSGQGPACERGCIRQKERVTGAGTLSLVIVQSDVILQMR